MPWQDMATGHIGQGTLLYDYWMARGDPLTKRYKDFCKRTGFKNLITDSTHYSNDGKPDSCLDHFLTSAPDLYSQHGICPYMKSDHLVIYGARKKVKYKKNFVRARSYLKYDANVFADELAKLYWSPV